MRLRASCARLGDELPPSRANASASQRSRDELLVDQPLGHDHMRQRIDHRDIGAGPQRQVVVGLHVRRSAPCRSAADR